MNIEPNAVKQKIELALKKKAEREAELIFVTVQGTRVILTGAVYSFEQMKDARMAAWEIPGVTSVENNLQVLCHH